MFNTTPSTIRGVKIQSDVTQYDKFYIKLHHFKFNRLNESVGLKCRRKLKDREFVKQKRKQLNNNQTCIKYSCCNCWQMLLVVYLHSLLLLLFSNCTSFLFPFVPLNFRFAKHRRSICSFSSTSSIAATIGKALLSVGWSFTYSLDSPT